MATESREHYTLRYLPHVPFDVRKHAQTLGRWSEWVDAEDERERRPDADLLEVVVRGIPDQLPALQTYQETP
jgi:hypothetical protein